MPEMTPMEPPAKLLLLMSQEERRKWKMEKMNQWAARQKSKMGEDMVSTNPFHVGEQEAHNARERITKQVENLKAIKALKDMVNVRDVEVYKEPFYLNIFTLFSEPSLLIQVECILQIYSWIYLAFYVCYTTLL